MSPTKSQFVSIIWLLYFFWCGVSRGQTTSRECKEGTLYDVVKQIPGYSIGLRWTTNIGADLFLKDPNAILTLFAPLNDGIERGVSLYAGTGIDLEKLGSGFESPLAAYNTLVGQYSPDQLLSVPSVNTALGQFWETDFLISSGRDEATGDLMIFSRTPGNVARVINVTKACNGYVYITDEMLRHTPQSLPVPVRYDYGARLVQVLVNGTNCRETLPEAIQRLPGTNQWMQVLQETGMVEVLSNTSLSSTIFVPQDQLDAPWNAAGATSSAVLYNMVKGEYCPEELVKAGSRYSMLGEATQQQLPLRFADENGEFVVYGDAGDKVRVLSRTVGCNSLIYITDKPLTPPSSASALAAPKVLPTETLRHMTCNVYDDKEAGSYKLDGIIDLVPVVLSSSLESSTNSTVNAEESSSEENSSSSSNTAIAIGLGVGLGCAALFAIGGVIIYKQKQKRSKSALVADAASAEKLGGSGSDTFRTSKSSVIAATSDSYDDALADTIGSTDSGVFVPAIAVLEALDGSNPASGLATSPDSLNVEGLKVEMPTSSSGGSSNQVTRLSSTNADPLDPLWEIDPSEIRIVVDPTTGAPIELGRGSYGAVYKALLRDVQLAAVKVLSSTVAGDAEAQFQREAVILKHVNRDRNVVQLYGSSKMPDGRFLLVTEFVERGDLRKALDNPELSEELRWSKHGKSIALDIARGLTALHALKIVHRDLKSKNILLTESFTAKIADVGIAAVHSQGYLTASAGQVVGTLAWSAPELLMGQRCTDKVDMYSFGVVLLELVSGEKPQRGFLKVPEPSDERCPAELSALIANCLSADPKNRPSAKKAYEILNKIPTL